MVSLVILSAAMIKVTIKQAAIKRGIKTAYQLAQVMGDQGSKMTAARLWAGNWPRPETLDRIAEVLVCGVDELITRVPDKVTKKAQKSPARQSASRKAKRKGKSKPESG